MTYFVNRTVRAVDTAAPTELPLAFHQRLPGYATTPLVDLPELARAMGLGRLWVKDESQRLGMLSFKILGASYATYRALESRLGGFPPWQTVETLAELCAPLRPFALAAATDGNHGRAVARMARLLGFGARIFVPAGTAQARIDAIASEGAQVTVVDGTYDEAVARSADEAGPQCLVISDTSWPGYEEIPRYVIEGYATIFAEVDDELARRGEPKPNLVVVQMGVGALAAAAVGHYRAADERRPTTDNRHMTIDGRPAILGVEPSSAACVLASMQVGRVVEVPGPHISIMAGLNCGLPSLIAWPVISSGMNAFIAIEDQHACQAVRDLDSVGITAGETGVAGLGGLTEALFGPNAVVLREHLGISETTSVLLILTEGATDPVARQRILAADCARDCVVRQACKAE